MITDNQLNNLKNNQVTLDLLNENGCSSDYYTQPLKYIQDELGFKLNCTGQEYRYAVEMANDEDICPSNSELPIIVDGVLAFINANLLAKCGLDLVTYFAYRFHPPNKAFKDKLDAFEKLIKES